MDCRLTAINLYPVKSLAGLALQEAQVTPRGLAGDRRWLLIDDQGRFLSQRSCPALARVKVTPIGDQLHLTVQGREPLVLPRILTGPRRQVQIWRDSVAAVGGPDKGNRWFSEYLGQPCQLAYMDEDCRRPVDLPRDQGEHLVSFADGFPCLVISQASLDLLNSRLEESVTMDRFRTNLVVSGCPPHAEDGWTRIRIGEVVLRGVKPCSRCNVPTIDQETGQSSPLGEPLRTLATYRSQPAGIMFGMNLVVETPGTIALGQKIEILAQT